MIRFLCSKCGNTLERPETAAGVAVFCDCGQGNVVPWSSTTTTPPTLGAALPTPPEPPPLLVIPISDEQIPVGRDSPGPRARDDTPARERNRTEPRNPKACFNHQDRPGVDKCADCGEIFCGDCLIKFKGGMLCGPCKNFRLRKTRQTTTVSGKAVTAMILAMCCAPLVLCMVPMGISDVSMVIGAVALLGECVAMMFGGMALRDTEKNPRLTGRSMAITTLLTAGLAMLMTVGFLLAGWL